MRHLQADPGLPPGAALEKLPRSLQVAIFLLGERVYALDDRDPVSGIALLSRGIVGDLGGEPVVASPLYKQRYALDDGRCLDDAGLAVRSWPTRLDGDQVWINLA
ncbi:MAG: nitrite reductase small subunit NirD [Aeromonas molluscorum]